MKRGLALTVMLLVGIMPLPAAARSAWPLWDRYAASFVGPDGRVIDPDRDGMTTSEGQSYALFFSLVANDRPAFQRVLVWTENNLAQGDLSKNLPAWSWGRKSDGTWGMLDSNSASDSDLWIAYDLIEGGILWRKPDYTAKGKCLLARISQEEVANVPNLGPVLVPGRHGFQDDSHLWILNPSYMPLPLLYAASRFAPQGPWKRMALALPGWLRQVSPDGFAMDWVECKATGCSPAAGPAIPVQPARGSYDAIRVYLWAGMTAKETPGATKLREVFAPMLRYVKAHSVPPESVASDGTILNSTAPASFAAALIPFAVSSGDTAVAAQLQQEVAAGISKSTGLLGSPARYYDQNLMLFALGWQEQHFRFAPDGTLRASWKS